MSRRDEYMLKRGDILRAIATFRRLARRSREDGTPIGRGMAYGYEHAARILYREYCDNK